MTVSRTTLWFIVFVVMLGMPLAVGCQAQTDDLPTAEPTAVDSSTVDAATATVVPVDEEPEAESTPTATMAATAPVESDVQVEPTEAATEEDVIDDEETPTPAPEDTMASTGANADVKFVRAVPESGRRMDLSCCRSPS